MNPRDKRMAKLNADTIRDDNYLISMLSGWSDEAGINELKWERGGLPWWVDEAVLVVEGFEKPEDGDEHDDVASQHQPTSSRRNLKQKDLL